MLIVGERVLYSWMALLAQGAGRAAEGTVPTSVAVLLAVLTPLVSIGVAWITSIATNKRDAQRRQHESDLQKEKLQTDLRTEFMAEEAIKQLLKVNKPKRSFLAIQRKIGGFTEKELRQLLVRSGAVRFYPHGMRPEDTNFEVDPKDELWGLRERNIEEVDKEDS